MTDGMVTSRLVLRMLTELQRLGSRRVLEQLEAHEPDLAEFVMEELTNLQHDLWTTGASDQLTRRLYRRTEQLALTPIMALREAQAHLLNDLASDPDDPASDEPIRDESRESR